MFILVSSWLVVSIIVSSLLLLQFVPFSLIFSLFISIMNALIWLSISLRFQSIFPDYRNPSFLLRTVIAMADRFSIWRSECTRISPRYSALSVYRNPSLPSQLRPNAVSLVDSIEQSDRELNSVLGRRDGNVYEALYQWAKQSELNYTDVSCLIDNKPEVVLMVTTDSLFSLSISSGSNQ